MQGISRPYPAPRLILLPVTLAKALLTSLFKKSEIIGDKLKGKTYKEAIIYLEDVCQFLEYKGHGREAITVGSSIDQIVLLKSLNARQATLDEYFSQ